MDDEPIMRESLALRDLGHEVIETEDGRSAIDRFRQNWETGLNFDLLFHDLTIPGGLGGCETLEVIRAFNPGVCAVVMIGYTYSKVMANPQLAGFAGVLPKSFTTADLVRVIESLRP